MTISTLTLVGGLLHSLHHVAVPNIIGRCIDVTLSAMSL